MTKVLVELTLANEESVPGSRERRRTAKAMASLRATIAALTRDLLMARTKDASEGWCFRPESSPYFTETQATLPQYRAVKAVWPRLGLMERLKGIRHGHEFDGAYVSGSGKVMGRAPRLRATTKLLALAADHGITPENLREHYERSHDATYPVILRRNLEGPEGRRGGRKIKEAVKFPRTAETDRIAEEVRSFNAFLAKQSYDPPMAPQLVAIFGEDKDRPGELAWGGRLTSSSEDNFQNWPKEGRRALRINGEAVVEVDLKASHPTIYHALLGVLLPEGADPYLLVPRIPRSLVKRMVSVLLSNGHLRVKQWPQGLADEYRAETGRTLNRDFKLQETVNRIVEAIPALAQLPDSGITWGDLQRVEASILRATLTRLREAGVPGLPIHDSILVPESQVDLAATVLREEFQKETKATPGLVLNRLGQPSVPWTGPKRE
ncbi:hypothetical protein Rumeso_02356 [Rubellimicrobium mesophilum DSM 19309]|uniref:Uncharacterized protein n=1 Tax=Rubellimicrobium mesophilum DSM 19309 TaxID=442562 RepID=A0A017HQP7_9RHOB|nr:hypothetical protein [Rubellimicrobium mesophilum]EYD76049.1 hypothetical protein Rumeso_02356 [Rubellimicrobium mesophilum DSM 19309]